MLQLDISFLLYCFVFLPKALPVVPPPHPPPDRHPELFLTIFLRQTRASKAFFHQQRGAGVFLSLQLSCARALSLLSLLVSHI